MPWEVERIGNGDRVAQSGVALVEQVLFADGMKVPDITNSKGDSSTSEQQILSTFELSTDAQSTKIDLKPASLKAASAQELSTEPITMEQYGVLGKEVLLKINPNGAGASKEQLAKAMEDPSFNPAQAQALAAIYGIFDQQKGLNHGGFFGAKTFTLGDLDKSIQNNADRLKGKSDAHDLSIWAAKNLDKFAQKDGAVHAGDIQQYLGDPKVSDGDKRYLQKLSELMPKIDRSYALVFGSDGPGINMKDQGIMYSDLNAYASSFSPYGPDFFINRTSSAESGNHNLYASSDPLDSIKPDGITQGMISDCYFEGALAAVAVSNPERIRDAIKDNHDGTYTVTFPGANYRPVTVKAPTDQELGTFNSGGDVGVWASVMEKAYGQLKAENPLFIDMLKASNDLVIAVEDNLVSTVENLLLPQQNYLHPVGYKAILPQENADNGGYPDTILKLLTNKDVAKTDLTDEKLDPKHVAEELQLAFASANPEAVTATSRSAGFLRSDTAGNTPDGFVKYHVFSVTGFKSDNNGGGTVSLRNPWNLDDGPNGDSDIPLAEFIKNFGEMDRTKN